MSRKAMCWLVWAGLLLTGGCRRSGYDAWTALSETGAASGRSGSEWTHRSQWEVTRDHTGLYRAYHIRELRPDRLIVTVSSVAQAQDWKPWLLDGSPHAQSRVTLVVARPDARIVAHYDHLAEARYDKTDADDYFEKLGATVAAGDGVYAPGRRLIAELSPAPSIWTGFYARSERVQSDHVAATNGLAPYAIGVASCVDLADMQVGDVLIRLWPWDMNDAVFASYQTLNRAVRDRFQVGDPVLLEYLRPEGDGYRLIAKTFEWPGLPYMDQEPGSALKDVEAHFLSGAEQPEKALLDALIKKVGADSDYADLMQRLARRQALTDVHRLPSVAAAHKHPWLMEPIARYHLDALPAPAVDRIAAQIRWLNDVFITHFVAAPESLAVRDYRDKDLAAHLDHIEDLLALAAYYHQQAFRHFSADELLWIESAVPGLLEGFVNAHMMCFDQDVDRQRSNVNLLGMAQRLDMSALIRQAETVARIVDGHFLASLKTQMESAPNPARRIARRSTPWGDIILDGTDDNRYLKDTPAVLINLGGDNFYANNTGSSIPGKVPSAVLVDFAGNDRYENWSPMRQGTGFMGVGILLDIAGDDTYIGIRHVQGTGFMGIGVLADMGGSDTYRAIDYGQGVGQFGAGMLLDDAGNNRYEGHQTCQGVGFTAGVGLLYSADPQGHDQYYNKGLVASGYRDAGSFEGWGQGLGVGHRPYTSGGLGMLVDEGGDDVFEGGTFSLGGGYFYGMGILNNRAGNDRYRGSRYNMGFSAHQAVGVFLEDGGDDHYETSHFVALGMAWDESVTLFIDRSGDDVYIAPGFAFGAAAMNGLALFVDGGGDDRFEGAKPAAIHGNSYHGGTSIGFFLALGEGKNGYHRRETGEMAAEGRHAFFVDAPSIEAAMEKLLQTPLGAAQSLERE